VKKIIAVFAVGLLLATTWFLVAQAPPGLPVSEAVVEDATNLNNNPAPPGFPATIPVAPAPAPTVRTNPANPLFQAAPRVRTNAPAGGAALTNRTGIPVRPLIPVTPANTAARPGGNAAATPAAGPAPALAPPPVMSIPAFPQPTPEEGAAKPADADVAGVTLRFQNTPIDQVVDFYADLSGRMVLRSPAIPATTTISIKTQVPLTRTEARQALDTVLALNGFSTVPLGDKMLTLVPNTQVLQEGAAFGTGNASSLPESATFITQIVKLTNALPSEVAQSLAAFSKTPNGVVPLDSSMVLVLRDYAVNVKRMVEMIDKIDRITESAYKLEVIPIKYGKVADIYEVMSGLIGGGGGGGAGGTSRATSRRSTSSRGGTAGRGGSTLANNRMNPNALGQPAAPAPTGAANSFQRNLQNIVARAAGGDSQILGDAKIIPDERANSLVVYADKRDMEVLTNIVGKLDVALAQVLIEAVVMEVSIGKSYSLGVSAAQQPKSSGKFTGAGSMNNGASLPIGSGGAFGSGGTNGAAGLLGGSGLSYLGSFGNNFDVLITALASDSSVNVISKPRIQTTHAVQASFFVGDTVPYITGTSYGYGYGGGPSSQYTEKEVGVDLQVTPYITPDGLVVMEIYQDISQLGPTVKIDNNDVPTTTKRSAESTVSVEDGKTIMLGGYILSTKTKSNGGVPLLKDIPVLGNLFRSKSSDNKRTELMVLMRPTVLKRPQDAARAADIERARLPGVRATEREFMIDEQKRLDQEEKEEKSAVKSKKFRPGDDF
jgi:general secretion pathway protein D